MVPDRQHHADFAPATKTRNGNATISVHQLTRSTVAMVLAGGRGSRLGPLTDWRAKPAVPFGGKFRIIDFALSNCINSGIRRVGVCTQYKAQSLIRHVQRGWSFLETRLNEFVEILPAQQQIAPVWYQGTADAIYQNLALLRGHDPKYVLVLAGDHIYKMDYGRMIAEHVERNTDITIGCVAVPLAEASAFGVMSIDAESRVVGFDEKPANPQPMPGDPGRRAGQHGHLRVRRRLPLRPAAAATPRTRTRSTISAATSFRARSPAATGYSRTTCAKAM